jgi:hypothetical protein
MRVKAVFSCKYKIQVKLSSGKNYDFIIKYYHKLCKVI